MRRCGAEQISEEELIDEALDWLGVDRARRSDAAEQIRQLKTQFLKETDDYGGSATLGQIAKALRQERDTAHGLAISINEISRRLHYLLPLLGHDHNKTHNILADRIELAQKITELALRNDKLADKIPTTGPPNLHHLVSGKPITLVAYQTYHMFSKYHGWPQEDGKGETKEGRENRRDETKETRGKYRGFADAVYAFISNGGEAPELGYLCDKIELANRKARPLEARLAEIRRQKRVDFGRKLIAEEDRIKHEITQIKFPRPLS